MKGVTIEFVLNSIVTPFNFKINRVVKLLTNPQARSESMNIGVILNRVFRINNNPLFEYINQQRGWDIISNKLASK